MVFVLRVFSCWGQRLLCSFVTVFLLFPLFIAQNMLVWSLYLPFYPCVVNLGFLSSVSTVEVDQIETTENGRHVCNLKVVHNHQLTWLWLFEDRITLSTGQISIRWIALSALYTTGFWIKVLCSTTMSQKSSLWIVPNSIHTPSCCHLCAEHGNKLKEVN